MITLYNVIDTRTGNFYRIAIVKERNVKWFVEAEEKKPQMMDVGIVLPDDGF